jgi:hypothetical protein
VTFHRVTVAAPVLEVEAANHRHHDHARRSIRLRLFIRSTPCCQRVDVLTLPFRYE